jgi:LuxR family maltose regulon positive regulatory protein
VALEPQRSWYRYHGLFREAPHRELRASDAAAAPTLLRRAALWFRSAGDVENAVRCLIASDDPVAAARPAGRE